MRFTEQQVRETMRQLDLAPMQALRHLQSKDAAKASKQMRGGRFPATKWS